MQDKDVEALVPPSRRWRASAPRSVTRCSSWPWRRCARGSPALQRPAGLQRRRVTVLFADVVGSTAMAGELDAEDTLDVLSGALRRMAALVEAHQGRVLRFTGDGVKAAFGMDEAREDDPERAVRAGLAILAAGREQADAARRAHGIADFAVRVGVHTGDVALGAGVEADNTAMGAAVNIAARMEQSAPPGALRISHDTWNHVRGLFDVEPQPPLQVKGVERRCGPTSCAPRWTAAPPASSAALQGLSTPMVGRHAELQRLLQAVAGVRETRQLQALTLRRRRRPRQEPAAARAGGRAASLGRGAAPCARSPTACCAPGVCCAACWPCSSAWPTPTVPKRRGARSSTGWRPWFAERGERQAQLIGQLSGLDFGDSPHVRGLDPRALRDQAFAALRGYLQALAAADDRCRCWWSKTCTGPTTARWTCCSTCWRHAAELPLALVMSGRPALLARRPDWGTCAGRRATGAAGGAHTATSSCRRCCSAWTRCRPSCRADRRPGRRQPVLHGGAGAPADRRRRDRRRRTALDGAARRACRTCACRARWSACCRRGWTRCPPANAWRRAQASVVGHVFWDDALQAMDPDAPQALPALQRAAFVKPTTAATSKAPPNASSTTTCCTR